MKIYLAASETQAFINYTLQHPTLQAYNHLFSYYYTRQKTKLKQYLEIQPRIDNILIDSGAHTFHTAQNANFEEYTIQYSEFIRKYDQPNVQGYFEMDIDNRIGYKNVLRLRRILEETTDKIIPVWHKNRGYKNYQKMCRNYDYVSISCLPIEGIPDKDLIKFAKEAHDNDCMIHGLGGTRKYILENVPFDSVDSASWMFSVVYGRFQGKKITRESLTGEERLILSFLDWRKKQEHYKKYWRKKQK
ncbi:MAG: hypothetical protein IJH63_10060 [Methanobrevibacter sp.]|nr:hypothetical protein [Methanosphaera sp.]MBR0371042.1 hypothetical protein [Methanobrevibacter sp.]